MNSKNSSLYLELYKISTEIISSKLFESFEFLFIISLFELKLATEVRLSSTISLKKYDIYWGAIMPYVKAY